jgi:hypothetical protein
MLLLLVFVFLLRSSEALRLRPTSISTRIERRDLLSIIVGVVAPLQFPAVSAAFENSLPEASKYLDRPKRRGPQPTDLGLSIRTLNSYGDKSEIPLLKGCKGSPNCFSTTVSFFVFRPLQVTLHLLTTIRVIRNLILGLLLLRGDHL